MTSLPAPNSQNSYSDAVG